MTSSIPLPYPLLLAAPAIGFPNKCTDCGDRMPHSHARPVRRFVLRHVCDGGGWEGHKTPGDEAECRRCGDQPGRRVGEAPEEEDHGDGETAGV